MRTMLEESATRQLVLLPLGSEETAGGNEPCSPLYRRSPSPIHLRCLSQISFGGTSRLPVGGKHPIESKTKSNDSPARTYLAVVMDWDTWRLTSLNVGKSLATIHHSHHATTPLGFLAWLCVHQLLSSHHRERSEGPVILPILVRQVDVDPRFPPKDRPRPCMDRLDTNLSQFGPCRP